MASLCRGIMSEAPFDPNHKWLGIPSAEQPANHGRLLVIQLFQQEEEVTENSATRKTEYLRTFAVGPIPSHPQKSPRERAVGDSIVTVAIFHALAVVVATMMSRCPFRMAVAQLARSASSCNCNEIREAFITSAEER